MGAHHVSLANFVAKKALQNQVETVQVAGTAYGELGPINQLMLVLLDTLMVQTVAFAQTPQQEEPVSQAFSAQMGHVSLLLAQEVRKSVHHIVLITDSTNYCQYVISFCPIEYETT